MLSHADVFKGSLEVDVYEMVANPDETTKKLGLAFNLEPPCRCHTMQEVGQLPFIARHFKKGNNRLFFRFRKDFGVYIVVLEANPSANTPIIALAKFLSIQDTGAVDPEFIH